MGNAKDSFITASGRVANILVNWLEPDIVLQTIGHKATEARLLA